MPSVFFAVKYKARAIAKERSARRIGNEIFGASVEAPPTQDSRIVHKGSLAAASEGTTTPPSLLSIGSNGSLLD